jgi:hypothetical protein
MDRADFVIPPHGDAEEWNDACPFSFRFPHDLEVANAQP